MYTGHTIVVYSMLIYSNYSMAYIVCPDELCGHNYTGHNYTDHDYIGHAYIGHNYEGHIHLDEMPAITI